MKATQNLKHGGTEEPEVWIFNFGNFGILRVSVLRRTDLFFLITIITAAPMPRPSRPSLIPLFLRVSRVFSFLPVSVVRFAFPDQCYQCSSVVNPTLRPASDSLHFKTRVKQQLTRPQKRPCGE